MIWVTGTNKTQTEGFFFRFVNSKGFSEKNSYKSVYLCIFAFLRLEKRENLRYAYSIHNVCSFEVTILYVVPDQVRSQNQFGYKHIHLETLPLVQKWLGITDQEIFFVKCMHVMFSCKKIKLLWGFLMFHNDSGNRFNKFYWYCSTRSNPTFFFTVLSV